MQLRGMAGFEPITGEEIVRKFRSQVEYLEHARLADRATLVEAGDLPVELWPALVSGAAVGAALGAALGAGLVLAAAGVVLALRRRGGGR